MTEGIDLLATVLAEKILHKAQLHMIVESNGSTIPLSGLFGFRIFPKDDKFVVVQLVTNGKDCPIRYQVAKRVKHVVQPKKNSVIVSDQKELDVDVPTEDLF